MTKEEIAWKLYAFYDYCMTGYSFEQIKDLPKKELVARLNHERDNARYG